jgi:hypothetical protein
MTWGAVNRTRKVLSSGKSSNIGDEKAITRKARRRLSTLEKIAVQKT